MVLNWLECFFFKYKDLINNLRFLYNAFLPMLFASLRYILLLLTLMRFCLTAFCYENLSIYQYLNNLSSIHSVKLRLDILIGVYLNKTHLSSHFEYVPRSFPLLHWVDIILKIDFFRALHWNFGLNFMIFSHFFKLLLKIIY